MSIYFKHTGVNSAFFMDANKLYELRRSLAIALAVNNAMGMDLLHIIDKCDDFELINVCNYLSYEYGRNEYILDTDLKGLAEILNPDAWCFAYGIIYGDGKACYSSDNWVYMDSDGYVKALDFDHRRAFMLERIAEFTRDEVIEALEECNLLDGETIY